MATLVINTSAGIVSLDRVGVRLNPGERKEFECTEDELLVLCPELYSYKLRNRVLVSQDAILVDESSSK